MESFKRDIAIKSWIIDIINSEYKKDEDENTSYIISKDGKKISRVNIIGTIINISDQDLKYFIIDDGTGEITIMPFNNQEIIENLVIGEVITVIGRVREFGDLYIVPEIIKKIFDKMWIEVRKLELGYKIPQKDNKEEILQLINILDMGDGADYETIVSQLGEDAYGKIKKLFDSGDIFETKPGKIKVLN